MTSKREVLALYQKGYTPGQIAARFGLRPDTVDAIIDSMDVPVQTNGKRGRGRPRTYSHAAIRQTALENPGLTQRELADLLGVSRGTIQRVLSGAASPRG
jgi:DNA-binding MarR family transcriptional regulator